MPPKPRRILDMNAFRAGPGGPLPSGLLGRRMANAGASSVLFYREPIEMVRGRGVWLEAADGRAFLDFYNNVPSVGHCHPRVVEAVCRQLGQLNVNSRYLSALTETYAERLRALLPPDLSNLVLTCTGSEANDLALRIAREATGGTGFVVTETAYHGNTSAVTEVSPSALRRGRLPPHVRAVPAPGPEAYGADIAGGFARAVARAAASLRRAGHPPAALLADSIFSSDGIMADPPGFLAPAVAAMRAAGGCWIADEVQPGFGRTGRMWGFERHGITPDIVTMGKPMGNGWPMGGVAARPADLAAFCRRTGYFNTFGGTPAGAAAGLAVLDVLAEEGLPANAGEVGAHLSARLAALAAADPRLGPPRGAGLFFGLDIRDAAGGPDGALALRVIDGLRDRGVLIGAAGRHGAILKVRPPLCLTKAEADLFAERLAATLAAL